MKHVIERIEVSGDYLCVTIGGNVAYVAVKDLPASLSAQDALIEAKVDAMIEALPTDVDVAAKRTRVEAMIDRLKPIEAEAVAEPDREKG